MIENITSNQLQNILKKWHSQGHKFEEIPQGQFVILSGPPSQNKIVYYTKCYDPANRNALIVATSGNKMLGMENGGAYNLHMNNNTEHFSLSPFIENINNSHAVYMVTDPDKIGFNQTLSPFRNLTQYIEGQGSTIINFPQKPNSNGEVGMYALFNENNKDLECLLINGNIPKIYLYNPHSLVIQ